MSSTNGGLAAPIKKTLIDGDHDIHAKLQALHANEVAPLSQSKTNRRSLQTKLSYPFKVITESARYIRFVWRTVNNAVYTTVFGGLNPFDLFSVWFFALGSIVFLYIVLIFCLVANFPPLVRLYFGWSEKNANGLGLVNSLNPNLFKSLTPDQAAKGKEALSGPFEKGKDYRRVRKFNFDIAKILLQLAAVVYEHEVDAIQEAVGEAIGEATATGKDLDDTATSSTVKGKLTNKDRAIHEFAESIEINYEPVSELGDCSSAFCALFWDSYSNWIAVVFKGTGPIEFGEWLSDFNAALVNSGSYLEGFERVHKGFKDRVFPEEITEAGELRPYDNIAKAIRTVSKKLRKRNPDAPINVWFTGHSLGCATASLAYTGFLSRPLDLGEATYLRDAYLFAAPIVADRASVHAFNFKMTEDRKRMKTMWRITSNNDAVATLLPDLGDLREGYISPNNNFAFAHLGTEIILKDDPHPSYVSGNHIIHGTPVKIHSAFSRQELIDQRALKLSNAKEVAREWWGRFGQKIPVIGRFAAHATVNYWDQLDRVAVGKCKWVVA